MYVGTCDYRRQAPTTTRISTRFVTFSFYAERNPHDKRGGSQRRQTMQWTLTSTSTLVHLGAQIALLGSEIG